MAGLNLGAIERLTVFGGISLDTMVRVQALPQPDDKIWAEHLGDYPGGMGANVAANYAMLGGRAHLFGAVGDDQGGAQCLDELASVGVDISGVRRCPGATFKTVAMIGPDGEKAMLLIATANPPSLRETPALDLRPGRDAVHIAPGRPAPTVDLVRDWRRAGIRTSIDIEPAMLDKGLAVQEWLAASSLIFCGEKASATIGGTQDIGRRYAALLSGGAEAAIITRGRDGAGLATRDGQMFAARGIPIRAVDTTGAGDAFAGAFLWGLAQAWRLEHCLAFANEFAARTAGALGSRLPGQIVSGIRDGFDAGDGSDR